MAVITPPVVGLMLVMTVYVVSMSYFFTRMAARMPAGGGFTTAVASQEDETQIVLGALLAYAGEHRNRLPAHATELVAGGGIGAWDLILSDTGSLAEDVPLGGRTLDDLDQGQAVARRLADAAVKSLPANLAAYRVGDFVFPYVGGTLPVAGDLWLVIASPDPDQNPAVPGSEDVHVGRIDGQVEAIPGAQFDARLQEQNQLRAQHGLPPIPPPEQVLHQAPATAPSGSKMMEAVESPVEAE